MKKVIKKVKKKILPPTIPFIPVVEDEFEAPVDKLSEAKEIIAYLLQKLEGQTGKGIDRAKLFLS